MIFFIIIFERLGCIHKNKIYYYYYYYYYYYVLMKPSILIPNLYLYSIKIQTDINQNEVKNLRKIIYIYIYIYIYLK